MVFAAKLATTRLTPRSPVKMACLSPVLAARNARPVGKPGGQPANTDKERRTLRHLLARFTREDDGQDLVEYSLLITFIALACIVGMQQLGTAINNKYTSLSTSLAS